MKYAGILALLLMAACSARLGDGHGDASVQSDGGLPPGSVLARYGFDELRSPITAYVANTLRAISDRSASANDVVFMKVGASGTVSSRFLDCFGGGDVVLDGRDHLQPTIDYYNTPLAAGASSWQRNTSAAKSGRSANWVISGDPSPLNQEINAINPRIALVNYGTNDMSLGTTNETAMWPFHTNLTALLDELEQQGIIPIITGLNPRSDNATAARWVPTYNAVTRAIAEARQLPYINLYLASVGLPDMGLVSDGIHGNAFVDGSTRACVFTAEGLDYNYNIRNLLTLEMLHDVRRVAIDREDATDEPTAGHTGSGAANDPYLVDALPFTHTGDTSTSAHTRIDSYPACDTGQDEAGPELYYRLDISETTPIRILVLDRGDVDVDIHLLSGSPDASRCIDRDHRIIERTLDPGTYYLSIDSYVSSGSEVHSGAYSLIVLRCEPGDTRCD